MRLEGAMYRDREPTLAGELSPERLKQASSSLPEGICCPDAGPDRARPPREMHRRTPPVDRRPVKDGAYAIRDGLLAIRRGAVFETAKVPGALAWRIRGMLAVRDAVRVVFRTQLDDAPEERIAEARRLLNDIYDSFVSRHGPLSSRENVKAFAGDPDQPLLLSLETYDPETKRAAKTAIFERRTLERYRPVDACRDGGRSARRFPERDRRDPLAAHGAGDGPHCAGSCSASWGASSIAIRRAGYGKPPTAT